MLIPVRFVGNGMELEHVHVGLDGQSQPADVLAAALLVNLQELSDFRRHGIWRLGSTADRTNPVAEFSLLHSAGFAEIDQFDPLAPNVADFRSRRS